MKIPQFMPILSSGGHDSPEDGACIMELASFLAGEEWTDRPTCTNGYLAQVARMTNDQFSDAERGALLPLLPRLMGTDSKQAGISETIVRAAVEYVEGRYLDHDLAEVRECVREAIHDLNRDDWVYAISGTHHAVTGAGGDLIKFLSHLIDAYDKSVGRTGAATVTEDDLRRCAELTGAKA